MLKTLQHTCQYSNLVLSTKWAYRGARIILGHPQNVKWTVLEKYDSSDAQTLPNDSTYYYYKLVKFERRSSHIFRERAILRFGGGPK